MFSKKNLEAQSIEKPVASLSLYGASSRLKKEEEKKYQPQLSHFKKEVEKNAVGLVTLFRKNFLECFHDTVVSWRQKQEELFDVFEKAEEDTKEKALNLLMEYDQVQMSLFAAKKLFYEDFESEMEALEMMAYEFYDSLEMYTEIYPQVEKFTEKFKENLWEEQELHDTLTKFELLKEEWEIEQILPR